MDEDDVIAISNYLLLGTYPEDFTRDDKRSLRQKSSSFVCEADETGIHRLYHRGKHDKRQLVIYDHAEKQEILRTAHADVSGPGAGRPSTTAGGIPHNGINTTLRKISDRYWWRRLVEDVRSFCKNCPGCCHVGSTVPVPVSVITPAGDVSQVPFADASSGMEVSSNGLLPVSQMLGSMQRSPTYTDSLLSALSEMRNQNLFCDVTLASDDGTFQTKVHKVVLVAASQYLRSLFLDPDLIVTDHITVPNVSGSCLENLVSFMYSGILRLTPDTVNVMLLVATQLEISTAIELCQNFIANHYLDPSREKELQDAPIFADMAQDHEVGEIVHMREPAVKVEDEPSVGDIVSVLEICPSDTVTRTTRSVSRKSQATRSVESSQVIKSSLTSSREQTVATRNSSRRRTCTDDTEVSCESVPSKRSVSAASTSSSEQNDPDWKPTMNSACGSRYNRRKHSHPAVCKSVSSAASVQNANENDLFSSGDKIHPLRIASRCRTSVTGIQSKMPNGIYSLPAWQHSRRSLTVAGVVLAKRIKMTDDGLMHCRQCEVETFTSRSRLNAHVLRRHQRRHFCVSCGQSFVSLLALIRHRNSQHRLFPNARSRTYLYNKESGGSSASTTASLRNKCGWCGLKFTARSKLVEHRETVHRKRTDTASAPVYPRVVRDWNCREKDCGMMFKHKVKLCMHMAEHHPTVVFSCPECRFKTQVEQILKRHLMRRHRAIHSCDICGKAYHKPFLLRVHMYNRHRVEDPSLKLYRCSHEGCGYACPSKNGMSLHVLKHSQPDAFACEICGKTFKRLAGLDKHTSKIHLGIRPYICDKCGMSYSDEPELRMHIARHSDNKPYSCNLCSYSTFQKGSLKSHLFCRHQVLMDSKMPVLRCDYCSFVTDKRCRFDDHVKMHHNIRDIPCNQCGKLFVTKKTLRQHIIKVHCRTSAATTSTLTSALVSSRPFVIPAHVQKLNDEQQSSDDAVTAAVTSTTSQPLFTATDVIDSFNSSSFQSPAVTGYDHQPSVTPIEYQMLMPLTTAGVSDGTASLTQVAAVSGAGPIIVGISLPTIDSVTAYQAFQPFDLQNARLVL